MPNLVCQWLHNVYYESLYRVNLIITLNFLQGCPDPSNLPPLDPRMDVNTFSNPLPNIAYIFKFMFNYLSISDMFTSF